MPHQEYVTTTLLQSGLVFIQNDLSSRMPGIQAGFPVLSYDLGTQVFKVIGGLCRDKILSYRFDNFYLDHSSMGYFIKFLWYLPAIQNKKWKCLVYKGRE